jgi:hypothetical protein
MTPPLILISDHTSPPAITLLYLSGTNNISFPSVYKSVKSLLTHPTCTHRRSKDTWPCPTCETAFTTAYWSCAATLLDYFADFFAKDTSVMQAVWFHLLDIWQECATHLPYEAVLEDVAENKGGPVWGADVARIFEKDVRDTVEIFEITIWGRRKYAAFAVEVGESAIYDPRGEAYCPVGEYETGPWVSGVKPWGQYLGGGGMGVAASEPDQTSDADAGGEGEGKAVRFMPMPGIGIIQTHTERARTLATKLFSTQDPDNLTESLNGFDQHTIHVPVSKDDTATHTSPLSGQVLKYTLLNGAPPIMRYPGLGDPSMLVQNPDWNLLDECVASCKGTRAYAPQSGEEDEEEEEVEEDEDDMEGSESSEDEVVFDVWTVVETGGSEGGEKKVGRLDDMFDEWCGLDEF